MTDSSIYNGNLEFWMTNLVEDLKKIPIIKLAIPGSHGTLSYSVERGNTIGADRSRTRQIFCRLFSAIMKPLLYNWSVTQDENVTKQLNSGIRYIDLRLATKPHEESIYSVHGLYGAEVLEPLKNVNEWLSAHPKEVVILDCEKFYEFKNKNHRYFVDKIKSIFGNKLCPANETDLVYINLSWLNEKKYQVLVIYRNGIAATEKEYVWRGNFWSAPLPDYVDTEDLISFLNVRTVAREINVGFTAHCSLKPSSGYIFFHMCNNFKNKLFPACQKALIPWIQHKKPGIPGLNVVTSDYVCNDNNIFSRTVIKRNDEWLKTPKPATFSRE